MSFITRAPRMYIGENRTHPFAASARPAVAALRSEHPSAFDLHPAAPAEQGVLANLIELYAHDFSEFADLQLGHEGRYGYPQLPLYWSEEGRYPFLLRVEGRLAGFALVARGSRVSRDAGVMDLVEFFVVRRFRGRGVGEAAAREIFRRFPGRWEVRVMEVNAPALAFWRRLFRDTGAASEYELQGRRWWVFSFDSSGAVTPAGAT